MSCLLNRSILNIRVVYALARRQQVHNTQIKHNETEIFSQNKIFHFFFIIAAFSFDSTIHVAILTSCTFLIFLNS